MFKPFNLFNLFKRKATSMEILTGDTRIASFEYDNGKLLKVSVRKGYVLVHKNRDKSDFDPDNLEIITRAELMNRNRIKSRGK